MIILAHDGSIYGNWVARYAVRLATTEHDRKLLALHVQDGKISHEIAETRLISLGEECKSLNIEFYMQLLPLGPSVYRSLRQAIPQDPDSLLICGTRLKPRKKKYLTGSVSEKLLRMHQCPVLALRVVHPGLLGNPDSLLLPLAGHKKGFRRVKPIFLRLAPHLRTLHIYRAMQVNPFRYTNLSSSMQLSLKQQGRAYLTEFQSEMEESLEACSIHCDQRVTITSNWVNDLLTLASRLKSQLMLIGLTERSLAYRVLHGETIEKILQKTPCDVGIYSGL